MITSWYLSNLKSVREPTDLTLAPLTVFAGSNSSGKSTVLQSILLVAQTLRGLGDRQTEPGCVVLNGPLVRLGTFDDVRSHTASEHSIGIGFSLDARGSRTRVASSGRMLEEGDLWREETYSLSSVECRFEFQAAAHGPGSPYEQLHPTLQQMEMVSTESLEGMPASHQTRLRIWRARWRPMTRLRRIAPASSNEYLDWLTYDVHLEGARDDREGPPFMDHRGKLVGCQLRAFLPRALLEVYDRRYVIADFIRDLLSQERTRLWGVRRRHSAPSAVVPQAVIRLLLSTNEGQRVLRQAGGAPDPSREDEQAEREWTVKDLAEQIANAPRAQRQALWDVLRNRQRELFRAALGETPEHLLRAVRLPASLGSAAALVSDVFASHIRYLGPLRDEPRPLYPLAPTSDSRDVGLRGEYTAAVFQQHRRDQISYIPSTAFGSAMVDPEPVIGMLEEAVLDWLRYFGVAESLEPLEQGKLGHGLQVTTAGTTRLHDITHVGVGVSQVVPILVMALLERPGSTLILEQPELHLHPRVQTRLADFFLSRSLLGVQCLVETHSEYLISRLRYRVASAEGDSLIDDLRVYFVDKLKGRSCFREVEINRYGAILDWPEGFFDQGQREIEEILRAGMEKRRREKAPK